MSADHAAVVFMYAEMSVHAGTGRATGAIDLPIQRDPITGWPCFHDSTVRGGTRQALPENDAATLLGTEDAAGVLSTPDASILLFPVAAPRGVTAWITCPRVVRKCLRILELHAPFSDKSAIRALAELRRTVSLISVGPDAPDQAWVTRGSRLTWDDGRYALLVDGKYNLPRGEEEDPAETAVCTLASWLKDYAIPFPIDDAYWASLMTNRLAVVNDEAFAHLAETQTDLRVRIKVEGGGAAAHFLWTEENLPSESLLYMVVSAISNHESEPVKAFLSSMKFVDEEHKPGFPVMQIAGEQGLGRGWVRMRAIWEDGDAVQDTGTNAGTEGAGELSTGGG